MVMGYLDNGFSCQWLEPVVTVTSTTTPTAIDIANAFGPVLLQVTIPSGGSGTLSLQPVHSSDNSTFGSIPADAILDPITGLATTFANIAGAAGGSQAVYLKRDELKRYVSITFTNVGTAGSVTVAAILGYLRSYTSQSV